MLRTPMTDVVRYGLMASPFLGHVCIAQTDKGVCALFWRKGRQAILTEIASLFPNSEYDNEAFFVCLARQELTDYCQGKRRDFSVPLDLRGTVFRQQVWDVLLTIPYGTTFAYYDVACAVDNPKGVRAVAQACNANPVGIIVPCHRVIGKNGSLTGYASGLEFKQRLLELEGVLPGRLL